MTDRITRVRNKVRDDRRRAYRRTTTPQDPQNRLVALFIGFVLVGAIMVAVLVETVRDDQLRDYGESQRSRTRQLDGYRGEVLDRNGYVFAASTSSNNVVADPKLVTDPSGAAKALAPLLEMSEADIEDKLTPENKESRYVRLSRNVTEELADQIDEMRTDLDSMNGIYLESEEHREYPTGDVASQIVGRVDPDEIGITGIEQQYNEILDGQPGTEKFEGGRFGRISVGDSTVDPAIEGFDITLTLDHRLQFMAEQTLIKHCETTGAKSATAVMSEPSSGEILVMASVDRGEDGRCEVAGYNTALVDTFEPGSVMKAVTIAGGVQSLDYLSTSQIEVPPSITVAGKPFVDHPAHPVGMFPMSQILSNSMNVGTIKVAQELGDQTLYGYLEAFGFGQSTGLGFTGESVGTLRKPEDWRGTDSGSIAIGQGVTVNATQLVAAYNVFANGGTYQEPLLISSLRNADGEYFTPDPRPTSTVLSPEAAAEVTTMLEQVVTDGTGKRAGISGYSVAGKTGTAWKVFDDGSGKLSYGEPGNRRYVVTFAGLVPASNPKISMAVVVNEPGDVYAPTAGTVAAPIFSEIGEDAMRILGVTPDHPSASGPGRVRGTPAKIPVPVPNGTSTTVPARKPTDDESQADADSTAETSGDTDDDDESPPSSSDDSPDPDAAEVPVDSP